MNQAVAKIVKTYVSLTLLSTFASSFIWGINTLFLLDAGLTITQAFTATHSLQQGRFYLRYRRVLLPTRADGRHLFCSEQRRFL